MDVEVDILHIGVNTIYSLYSITLAGKVYIWSSISWQACRRHIPG